MASRLPRFWTLIWYALPAVLGFLILFGFQLPQYLRENRDSRKADFAIRFAESDWTLDYTNDDDVCEKSFANCPANPEFPRLWQGVQRNGWDHAHKIKSRTGEAYWIGLKISPQDQAKALAAGANQFLVGMFYGTFHIYIDGKLRFNGGHQDARDPVVLPLELSAAPEKPIFVAVRIINDMSEPFPDTLYFSGLATADQIRSHIREQNLFYLVEKSGSAGFNIALGVFLFLLFLSSPQRQELAAFSGFALLHATVQAAEIPFMWDLMGMHRWHQLNYVVACYEILFVIMVALALARIRNRTTAWLTSICLVLPWTIYLTSMTSIDIYTSVQTVWAVANYASYFVGAAICLGQAYVVRKNYLPLLQDRARIFKLIAAAVFLILMGSVEVYQRQIYSDYRILNSFLLAALSIMVVHDFRRQEIEFRRTPVSRFHLRAQLPTSVPSTLVSLDIKNSEYLLRQPGGPEKLIATMTQITQILSKLGAELILTEGDSVIFFFEGAENWQRAQSGLIECQQAIGEIHFRSTIVSGAIKPIWQEAAQLKHPSWAPSGNTNVFVTAARLLEAEKAVSKPNESSLVFLPSENSAPPAQTFHEIEIKHGRKMSFAFLKLDPTALNDRLAAAS